MKPLPVGNRGSRRAAARPIVALALFLGGLIAISLHSAAALRRPPDPDVVKFSTAEQAIAYRVTRTRGPRFRLEPGAAPIKVVSNVVVPGTYVPDRRVSYGLRLTIEHEGRTWWQRDVYEESRQSKARPHEGTWRDEAAFTADGLSLGDERIMVIDPPPVPPGATLTLTLLGASDEALLRLFRGSSRDAQQRSAAVANLDETRRWELVRSSTYVPWELLSHVERDRRLTRRWIRMSATGERGTDYATRTIFVSAFRAPPTATGDRDHVIAVSHHEHAAINVIGPTRLVVHAAEPRAGVTLQVHTVGGGARRWDLPVDRTAPVELDIGEGPATLVIATAAPDPVSLTVAGPSASFLAPAEVAATAAAQGGRLAPHRIRIPLVIAGPTSVVTARVLDVRGAPLLGRTLRVDARVVLDDTVDDGLANLRFRFVAADGSVVAREELVVGGPRSRFERLMLAGGVRAIGEPTARRIVAPPRAVRVEITADREVAVRLHRWLGGGSELAPPYGSVQLADHRWRYATPSERTWVPFAPANHEHLAASGQLAELVAQVRLEPLGDGDGDGDGRRVTTGGGDTPTRPPLVSIAPVGHPETQRAREPVPPEQIGAVLATWPDGAVTAIEPGRPRTLDFGTARPGRPQLAWETDPAQVGKELEVRIGAGPTVRVPLGTSRGKIYLPRPPLGAHPVEVTAPSGTRVWMDRPPTTDRDGLHREWNLYALREPVVVRVVRRGGARVRLHAIVYATAPDAGTRPAIRVTIGGGRPLRRAGVALAALTVADRTTTLPAARRRVPARLVDQGDRSAGLPRTISVTLLDDLVAGSHDVAFYNVSGAELWVRFVVSAAPASAPTDPRQWRVLPTLEEGDP